MQDLCLFQREERDTVILLSVFSSHNRSQNPVSWEKYMRKGNRSQRELSDPWEFMPKALIVFDETL